MWLLFDMLHPRILHTAPDPNDLRFEEGELPAHLATLAITRIESLMDPMFLGSRKHWPELNLRKLYTWLQLNPPLIASVLSEEGVLDLRARIRYAISLRLGIEPKKLPVLVSVPVVFSAPQKPLPPPRTPVAQRGSVGPLIHRVATEMWEAAGKPMDPGVILQLRRQIMTELLDTHKIKTATSSNELGRWQKQILQSSKMDQI